MCLKRKKIRRKIHTKTGYYWHAMGFSKMKPPDNIMPYAMTIIYALIFKKNFKATVLPTNDPNEYLLFLYAANMKYYTAYRLLPGKIKWEKGVLPDRIIK